MTEFVKSHAVLAVKLDLKCSCEKAYIRFWPVLCRLCVGNEEGSDCAGSAILAIEVFVNIKQRGYGLRIFPYYVR